MSIGSLFAGIGGFDIAARWLGWQTKWYSEIEPFACATMAKHFPNAVNHGDIKEIDARSVEPVDILCGGFPCQDISVAGRGAGIEGERSGLWTHYHRLIDQLRPRYVLAENVSALRSRGLDKVLSDLNAVGYDAEWHCIPAAHVGSAHRRDRIWIIAYAKCERLSGLVKDDRVFVSEEAPFAFPRNDALRSRLELDGDSRGLRTGDGFPLSVHRLRIHALGNAIVPHIAYGIFQAIARREARLAA